MRRDELESGTLAFSKSDAGISPMIAKQLQLLGYGPF